VFFDTGWADTRLPNKAPTIVQAAKVTPNPVTTSTAALSVLADDDGGERNIVYTWSVISQPPGGTAVFSINKTNAAKNSTATFFKKGTYSLSVTATDSAGLRVTSHCTVTVILSTTR
jgi:hypothetical protein